MKTLLRRTQRGSHIEADFPLAVASDLDTTQDGAESKYSGISKRMAQWLGIAAVAVLPFIGVQEAKAQGGPEPPVSPALRASVERDQLTLHYIASEVGRTNVDDFFQLRFSHRLTEKGPVFFFEDRTFPNRSENPKQFFVAVAEGIKFSNDAVLKLGLRSPDLLEDRFDPSKIHYGLILTHGKNLAELHYLGGEAARLTLGREVMGSSLSLSYAGEGYYYSRSQAVRLGWEDFHKAIPGLDKGFLRKFGTDAGVTFPVGSSGRLREEEPKMDVSLMYRLGKKTTAGVSTSRHTIGKERPTIEAWIVFNLP